MYDISLLHELKRGNREAFNSVFRYYYPKMMAYVSSFVDEETAEDIVQDVFLYVWEHREKLYVSEGFHSYLFQSAYTRCLDYFKKKSTAEKYESHVNEEYAKYYQDLLESSEWPIIDELSMKDFYKRLYELLDLLPEARRKVFILAYIEGLTAKEIVEQTAIPQRTVESHLYLALKFLRTRMSKNDYCLLCLCCLSQGNFFESFANQV